MLLVVRAAGVTVVKSEARVWQCFNGYFPNLDQSFPLFYISEKSLVSREPDGVNFAGRIRR